MFRFTIRELILLTLVVALALGWGLEHRRTIGKVARLESEAELAQRHVDVAYQLKELAQLQADANMRVYRTRLEQLEARLAEEGVSIPPPAH